MAGLEELAAALLGEDTQKAIAAENPYYKFQAVPESIGQSAVTLFAKNPGKYKTKDALAWGIGSGLHSGILGGAGDSYQHKLSNRYLQAVQGQQPEGDLAPSLFDRATRTRSMFQLQNAIKQREAQDKIDAAVGEKLALSPIDIASKVAEAKALLPDYEAKQQIKGKYDPSATKIDLGMGKQLPAATVSEIADSNVVIDEAARIADELEKGGGADLSSWIKLQGAKTFSGLDETGIQARLSNVADKVMRLRTGSSAPAAEAKSLQKIVAGDFTASPRHMAKLLRNFAASEAQGIKSKLSLANTLASGSTKSFEDKLDNIIKTSTSQGPAAPQIVKGPDGKNYVFTD